MTTRELRTSLGVVIGFFAGVAFMAVHERRSIEDLRQTAAKAILDVTQHCLSVIQRTDDALPECKGRNLCYYGYAVPEGRAICTLCEKPDRGGHDHTQAQ